MAIRKPIRPVLQGSEVFIKERTICESQESKSDIQNELELETEKTIKPKIIREIVDNEEDILLTEDAIYQKNKKVGNAIIVNKAKRNLDTKEIDLEVEFKYSNQQVVIDISRDKCLNKKGLLSLTSRGADVDESNSSIFIKTIKYQESKLENIENIHSSIGYSKFQEIEIFKLHKCIGLDSNYIGKLDLEPKGTLEKYLENIKKYVMPYTNTTMAFLIGCTSAIVAKLRLNDIDLENLLVHIYGESSSGKSTATILAISVWGNPSLNQQGLYNTWNATENALINSIGNNNGVACAFYELSMSKIPNFTQLIYNLTTGRDKARLSKEIEQREVTTWATTIISNGEASIRSQASKNTGLDVRILELANIKWTESALHSEKIKEEFRNNYGVFGFSFAEKLVKYDVNKLKQLFKNEKDKFKKKVESLGYTDDKLDRTSSKYALITLVGELINSGYKYDGINIDIEDIREVLAKVEIDNINTRGVEKNAEEWLLDIVSANSSKFRNKKDNSSESTDYWGTIDNLDEDRIEVAILKSKFEELISTSAFEDSNVILNEWKKNGILNHEEGRYTRKRKINKINSTVYVVTLTQ